MRCLALNSAGKMLSIAVTDGDNLLQIYNAPERKDQGNNLISLIEHTLEKARLGYADIDMLAAVTGPGSFTGIRIGLAAVTGIAMFPKKPVIGVTAFELYAVDKPTFPNIVAIESWREELYFSIRDASGNELCEAVNLKPSEFSEFVKQSEFGDKFVISGDAVAAVKDFLPDSLFIEDDKTAEDVARIAMSKLQSGADNVRLKPYYLRPADITISSKLQRSVR